MEFQAIGYLSMEPPPEELKPFFKRKCKTVFRAYNVAGGSVITNENVQKMATQLSLNIPEEERNIHYEKQSTVWKQLLLFGRESITEEEFVDEWISVTFNDAAQRKKFAEMCKKLSKSSFDAVDANKDGIINYDEFCKMYKIRCQNPSTTKVVFDAIDANSDGKITLEEWTHAWLSFVFVSGPECPFSLFYGQIVD